MCIICFLLHAVYFQIHAGIASTQVNATVSIYEAERSEPIEGIMNVYRANHGYDTLLLDENVCSRQYLIGGWSCHQIARHTLGFLDVLKDAVLSNQTFLAEFCESNVNERDCTITPKRWLPTVANTVSILESPPCFSLLSCCSASSPVLLSDINLLSLLHLPPPTLVEASIGPLYYVRRPSIWSQTLQHTE